MTSLAWNPQRTDELAFATSEGYINKYSNVLSKQRAPPATASQEEVAPSEVR